MKRKSEAVQPEGRRTRSIAAEDGIGLRSKKAPKKVVDSEISELDSNDTAKSLKLSYAEQRIRAQEYAALHFPIKPKTPAKTPLRSKTPSKKISLSQDEPEDEIDVQPKTEKKGRKSVLFLGVEIEVKPMTARKLRKSIGGVVAPAPAAIVESITPGRSLRQRDSLGYICKSRTSRHVYIFSYIQSLFLYMNLHMNMALLVPSIYANKTY